MTGLPIPAIALEDCGAILGRRGAGKSATKTLFFEHELDAGHRCCLIDPKGDGWGIRLNPDGSPSRFQRVPIFGGSHGDMPLDERQGAQLGRLIAEHDLSCVVDLSGFPSVAAMRRFARDFAEALFQANTQPLTLFVDEADQLAPQNSSAKQDGPVAMLLHHMEALIRQGRQRGIFMWMLTQRPQVLNKNLLSQAETLIAMKMTTPHDRKAIRDWMDAHDPEKAKEIERELAGLGVGEAFVWVPAADFLERVQFPLFSTYDSGRTPRHGERVDRVELPPIDLAAIRGVMAIETVDVVQTGGSKGKTAASLDVVLQHPEFLAMRADRDDFERQAAEAYDSGKVAGIAIGITRARQAIDALRVDEIPAQGGGGPEVDKGQTEGRQVMTSAAPRARTPASAARTAMEKAGDGNSSPAAPSSSAGIPASQQRVIDAIAWWRAVGIDPVERRRASVIAGLSPKASTFGVYISKLVAAGLVDTATAGAVALTPAGVAAANTARVDPAEVITQARAMLSPAAAAVFDLIVAAHPRWISRDDLADQSGLSRTASTLGVYISKASTLGFVETRRGETRAADWLFVSGST